MIYVLLSSRISEDAARCWARTFPKIARCPARWAGPSWFRASELNGDRFGEAGEAVHSISMSIPNMTHGSIEEVLQGPATRMAQGVNFFHRQACGPIAILIDLEGMGMDNSLAPLSWLEKGKCLEIWCGGARGERHRDWYQVTNISRRWLRASQVHPSGKLKRL